MPRNPMVARRYASALFDTIKSESKSDGFHAALQELEALDASLIKDKDSRMFFQSPAIKMSDKLETLSSLKEKLSHIYRFLITLVEADRFENLGECVEEFRRLVEENSGELSVDLQIAHPISDRLLDEIRNVLQEKWKLNLKIKTTIDSKIIGGFIARAPGKLLDASVASQLENLEQQIFA